MTSSSLSSCLDLLQSIFGSPSNAIAWLNYPHPSLGVSPLLALSQGQTLSVLKILEKMHQNNLHKTYD
jgi:hypothetical protein